MTLASHVTLNPIARKGKVIKVDPSYFCVGVVAMVLVTYNRIMFYLHE